MNDRANEGEERLEQKVIDMGRSDWTDELQKAGFAPERPPVDEEAEQKNQAMPDPDHIHIHSKEGILYAEGDISSGEGRSAILEILLNYKHDIDSAMHLSKMFGKIKVNGKDLTPTMIREIANLTFKQARDDVNIIYPHLELAKKGLDRNYFSSQEWKELVAKLSDPVARAEFQGEEGEYAQGLGRKAPKPKYRTADHDDKESNASSMQPQARTFEKSPEESADLMEKVREAKREQEDRPVPLERQVTKPNIIIDKSIHHPDEEDTKPLEEEDTQPDLRPVLLEDGQAQFSFMKGLKKEAPAAEGQYEQPYEPEAADDLQTAFPFMMQYVLDSDDTDKLNLNFNNWGDRMSFHEEVTPTEVAALTEQDTKQDAGRKRSGFRAALGAAAVLAMLTYSGNDVKKDRPRQSMIIPETEVETIYARPPTLDEFMTEEEDATSAGFWKSYDDKLAEGFHNASLAFLGGDGRSRSAGTAIKTDDEDDKFGEAGEEKLSTGNEIAAEDSGFKTSPSVHKKDYSTEDDIIQATDDVPDNVKRQYLRAFVRGKVGRAVSLSRHARFNLPRWATGQMSLNAAFWKGTRVDDDRRNDYRSGHADEEQVSMAEAWLLDYTGHDIDHFKSIRDKGISMDDIDFSNLGPAGQALLERTGQAYGKAEPSRHVARTERQKHARRKAGQRMDSQKTSKPGRSKPILQPPTPRELAILRGQRPPEDLQREKASEPSAEQEQTVPAERQPKARYGITVHKPETFEEKRDDIMTGLLQRIATRPPENIPPSTFPTEGPKTLTSYADWRFERLQNEFPDRTADIENAKNAAYMAIGDTTCIGNYVEIQLNTLAERCKYRAGEGRSEKEISEYGNNFLNSLRQTCTSYVNSKVPDIKNAKGESVRHYLIRANEQKIRNAQEDLEGALKKLKVVREDEKDRISPLGENTYDDVSTEEVIQASLARQVMRGSLSEQEALAKAHEFYGLEDTTPDTMADSYMKVQDARNAEKEQAGLSFQDVVQARLARQVMKGSISEQEALSRATGFYGLEGTTPDSMADSYIKVQARKDQERKDFEHRLAEDIETRIDQVFTEYEPAVRHAA